MEKENNELLGCVIQKSISGFSCDIAEHISQLIVPGVFTTVAIKDALFRCTCSIAQCAREGDTERKGREDGMELTEESELGI